MSEFKAAATGESEAQWRQFLSYLFAQSSTGTSATGVLAGLGVAQTATASGSIVVGRGAAIVQSSLTAGVSPLISNADKTIDVLTGSPMGSLPRYDLVIFNADSAALEVVVGTPNASPTDPPVSASHVKLARLRQIPTGQAGAGTIPNSVIDLLPASTTLNVPIVSPAWNTYTPVWSQVGGTQLDIKSGSLTGKWRADGKLITVQVTLVRGSDSNTGTNAYIFSLPMTGIDINGNGSGIVVRGSEIPVSSRQITGSTVVLVGPTGRISNANPGSWASGDIIQFTHIYSIS